MYNRKFTYLSPQSFGETGMSKSNFSSSIRPDPLDRNSTHRTKLHKIQFKAYRTVETFSLSKYNSGETIFSKLLLFYAFVKETKRFS